MKFKATVRDQRTFAGVCQACRSIQRRCVIKLHPARVRFFTNTHVADGLQVWAGCRTEAVFGDFHSQSQLQDNAIYCEVADLTQLLRVMRQAERCPNVTIKLTKNAARRPALRVSMQGALQNIDISHDVPVRVLSEVEVRGISAPLLENEVVQLVLPSLTELSMFVDKVRANACDRMTFTVQPNRRSDGTTTTTTTGTAALSSSWSLVIVAECFLASFGLRYNSVQLCEREDAEVDNNHSNGSEEDNSGRDNATLSQASVTVEVKRFARFLAFTNVTPLQVVLHLVDEKAVVLSVSAAGGTTLVGYVAAMAQ